MNQQELYNKISIAANIIHEKALIGSGNFIIVSSKFAEEIKKLELKKLRKKKLRILDKLFYN